MTDLEQLALSLTCFLELPFLEELIVKHETCLGETRTLLFEGQSIMTHAFIKYFADRNLQPKFDPVWITWQNSGTRDSRWNFLSECMFNQTSANAELLLPRRSTSQQQLRTHNFFDAARFFRH
jgi:hypothetical protein